MRRLLIYGLTLTIGLLPALAKAQTEVTMEPKLLSLQEAMDYAVKNNVTAKNARLDALIQRAKNAEITGTVLPQVNAKGEYTYYPNQIQSFVPAEFVGGPSGTFIAVPFTPKHSSTASATASQVLFNGSVIVALQARNTLMKLYEQSARLSEEEIRYNVQKAYYSFVIAKRQFAIIKETMASVRTSANDMKVLYETGMVEKIDIDRTNVQLNNLKSDSIRIGNLIEITDQLLKYQMGMSISQPLILTDTLIDQKVQDASQMLLSTEADYDDRIEYNILETQLLLNKYDLKRHRFSGLPSLNAFGSVAYTYATNKFSDVFTERYIFYSLVGLQLNVPIFDGLQRRNRVKQAKFAVEKSENSIENLKLAIDFQVSQSTTSLKNAIMTMENEKRNLELANSVVDLANKKYKAGVGNNQEVTLAQSEMLQAQNNYFNAMLDVINAKSELQKARGQFK